MILTYTPYDLKEEAKNKKLKDIDYNDFNNRIGLRKYDVDVVIYYKSKSEFKILTNRMGKFSDEILNVVKLFGIKIIKWG